MKAVELFNNSLPAALTKNAADAQSVNAKFQINIEGAGKWHLDLTKSGPTCKAGEEKADCTVNISNANFEKLIQNPKSAATMFMFGQIKVQGNQMLGMKLEKIFNYVK